MLYRMLESLMNVGSWDIAAWGLFALAVAVVGGLVATKMTQLLRLLLVVPVLLEIYFLTPSFACARSQMFVRAADTQAACNSNAYSNYLDLNFGLNHWYVWVLYAGVALFMVWPLLNRYRTDKDSRDRVARYTQDAELALKRIDKIEHIG